MFTLPWDSILFYSYPYTCLWISIFLSVNDNVAPVNDNVQGNRGSARTHGFLMLYAFGQELLGVIY